jgi:2-polyprenyl-3-methyl-5-hydroxy-6-metoxy-1,4-benzoquinol methylase
LRGGNQVKRDLCTEVLQCPRDARKLVGNIVDKKFEEVVWTPEMVARYWAFVADKSENYFTYQVSDSIIARFRNELKSCEAVADYGAGPGYLVESLLAINKRCAAIEFSQSGVDALKRKFEGHRSFLGAWPINQTESLLAKFEAVFLTEVVEHLYDAELAKCLGTIRNILAPRGFLLLTTPNDEDRSLQFIMSPETGHVFHRWQHVRSWTADSLSCTIGANGFNVVHVEAMDFATHLSAFRRSDSLPLRLTRSAFRRARILAGFKAPNLCLVARKA